jgi:hypothetical protein
MASVDELEEKANQGWHETFRTAPGYASQLVASPEYQEVSRDIQSRNVIVTLADFKTEDGDIK